MSANVTLDRARLFAALERARRGAGDPAAVNDAIDEIAGLVLANDEAWRVRLAEGRDR